MSKLIRVSDEVHRDLDEVRGKGETFSQVIDRLIDIRRMIVGIEPILRGQRAFNEWKEQRDKEKAAAER